MSTSLLFYSNYCQHCKNIIKVVTNSPVKDSIKYICIDSKSIREKLPNYINNVPTLVVAQTNHIFVGDEILNWLQMNQQNITQQEHKKEKQLTENINDNINPYLNCEMSNFSDNYSFLNIDTSTKGNGGLTMIHNFESIQPNENISQPGSLTMPAGAPSCQSQPTNYNTPMQQNSFNNNNNNNNNYGSIQISEKSDILNKQMEDMISRRELDVPNVARI